MCRWPVSVMRRVKARFALAMGNVESDLLVPPQPRACQSHIRPCYTGKACGGLGGCEQSPPNTQGGR